MLFVTTIGQVAADVYLPSLPFIAHAFKVNDHLVQLTVSFYIIGFGVSPLIYGPLSDRYGRLNPLIIGLVICLIGSVICLFSTSITTLILGRLIQGIGMGAGSVTTRAVFRDIFNGTKLAVMISYLGMINMIMIAGAPIIGGYIQHYFHWRGNFVFLLGLVTFVLLMVIWKLPETNQRIGGGSILPVKVIGNYFGLLKSRVFLGNSMCIGLSFAGILSYLTVAPFLLQNLVGLSPVQFGWTAILVCAAFAIGSFTNARLVDKYGMIRLMFVGGCIIVASGIGALIFGLLGLLNVWVILIPIMFFLFGHGLVFANAFSGAVIPFPKIAGVASALSRSIQTLVGALASLIMAIIPENNQIPLAVMCIVLGVLCLFFLKQFVCKSEKS